MIYFAITKLNEYFYMTSLLKSLLSTCMLLQCIEVSWVHVHHQTPRISEVKWITCTKEASIQWSVIHVLRRIQFNEVTFIYSIIFNSDVRYMYLRRFDIVKYSMFSKSVNIAKWGTWFQDGSVQWSISYVIKNLIQWSEVHVLRRIQLSEEPVLKKIQYSEMMSMYSRSFNNGKWITCTQKTNTLK